LSGFKIKGIIENMSDFVNPSGAESSLRQKMLTALQPSVIQDSETRVMNERSSFRSLSNYDGESHSWELEPQNNLLSNGQSVYGLLAEDDEHEPPLPEALQESRARLTKELQQIMSEPQGVHRETPQKTEFDGTLSMRGVVPDVQTETFHPAGAPSSLSNATQVQQVQNVQLNSILSGGSMADLSGYKDLSKAPVSFGDDDMPLSSLSSDSSFDRSHFQQIQQSAYQQQQTAPPPQHFTQEAASQEVDTEFSGNVKTLIRLVNELPEGVTKQTGAQIIRLTMEAMGISMEDVLSEAQSAQSEMLDAVRANIKKIEEYKTVIRKLETDIKYYQGKANELSEIIDLFILSNTTGNKMSMPDDLAH